MKNKILLSIAILALSGCSWHKNFKENDRQGQLLPDKSIGQLKKGMSPAEVSNILGSPVIYNLDDNRWEYIEYVKVKGKVLQNKHLILTFKDDSLAKIEKF